jgi:5-methylcytosine-specific restriction endonuclease McrA
VNSCVWCGEPSDDHAHCPEHRRLLCDYARHRRLLALAKGFCGACWREPIDRGTLCSGCRAKRSESTKRHRTTANEWGRLSRELKRARGECTRCKNRVIDGRTCAECRDKDKRRKHDRALRVS